MTERFKKIINQINKKYMEDKVNSMNEGFYIDQNNLRNILSTDDAKKIVSILENNKKLKTLYDEYDLISKQLVILTRYRKELKDNRIIFNSFNLHKLSGGDSDSPVFNIINYNISDKKYNAELNNHILTMLNYIINERYNELERLAEEIRKLI